MKINFNCPNSIHLEVMTQPWEYGLDGSQVAEALRLADDLGFYKVMLGEHFVVPRAHVPLSGDHYFHATVALAFAAGQTRRLKLASAVSILPLQNPIVQAKAWATLDWLSGGRACAVFGVGWIREEYEMLGVPFAERGRLCDEYVAAMIELWTSEAPRFAGRYLSFADVGFSPRPVQQPLPIWFGGDAEAVLRRVGRFGHGWSPFQTAPEKFAECLELIRDQPEYDGRAIEMFYALEMLNIGSAHQRRADDPRGRSGWDAGLIIEQCQWLAELGVTETILPLPPLTDFEAYLDRLRWIGEEVIPAVG